MMNQEEKNYKLFTQNSDGGITEREITQEELGRIFFHEGNREWDNVHMALPDPVWERIYEDGYLLYEGYTVDHSALKSSRSAFEAFSIVHVSFRFIALMDEAVSNTSGM